MSTPAKSIVQTTSRLSKVLSRLNAKPKLNLVGVKSLKLTYAFRNDHFGARHFAKEDLPRIRWANPNLDIRVERALKSAQDEWRPEMQVEFEDGKSATFSLQGKYSSAILRELMDAAGGAPWKAYKAKAVAAGLPILPGGEPRKLSSKATANAEQLHNLQRFRDLNPPQPAEKKAHILESSPAVEPTVPAPL